MEIVMETMDRHQRPLVIARGGASATAPEHTIAAFEAAMGEGADAIGLRVRLTRDGHPVVFGPAMLQRTTNGRGPLSAHTMRDLKRLDAGSWKDPRFGGQRIQTLQEVMERFRDRTRFWIELPEDGDDHDGIEERVVSTIEIYEAVELSHVQSAHRKALDRVRALNQEVKLAAMWTTGPLDHALQTARAFDAVCASHEGLGVAVVETIRAAGLGCYIETVDEPALVDRLIGWRVDGIFTGRPGLVRARVDQPESRS
jgi:glycerophosphoryl diester phosphodiesterase